MSQTAARARAIRRRTTKQCALMRRPFGLPSRESTPNESCFRRVGSARPNARVGWQHAGVVRRRASFVCCSASERSTRAKLVRQEACAASERAKFGTRWVEEESAHASSPIAKPSEEIGSASFAHRRANEETGEAKLTCQRPTKETGEPKLTC
jgi:hypothetical protein